jgi:hypothetical protein
VRRSPRAAAIAAVLLALLARERPARADAYQATLTQAIAAKERALDVNEPARWEEALRLFQEADAIRPTREAKYELGYAAERLRRNDLAVEAYEGAIDLGLTGAPRTKAEVFVGAHAASMARLELRGPAGLRVRVGGVDRGRLPLARPLVLFPGAVELELVAPDGGRSAQIVSLSSGHLDVLELPSGGLPAPGAAPTPLPGVPAPSPLARDQTPPPPPPPPPGPPGHAPAAAYWLAGAGLAIGAAAAVMLPVSTSQIGTARANLKQDCGQPGLSADGDSCPSPPAGTTQAQRNQLQSEVNTIATWKNVHTGAWIGVGAGLVAAITGISLAVAVRDGGPSGSTVGLVWIGRF